MAEKLEERNQDDDRILAHMAKATRMPATPKQAIV